jgi:hypothetical protein
MNHKIRDSSCSLVARLQDEKSWLFSRQYRGISFVTETSRPVLGLPNLLDNECRGYFRGVHLLVPEDDQASASKFDVKNGWGYV